MDGPKSAVYHEGERAVQRRAGVRRQAERLADMVGAAVPDDEDVRSLVADQPHAVVTSVDPGGDHRNSTFRTLGNVAANDRVGLLFVDFEDGRLLPDHRPRGDNPGRGAVDAYEGAERLIEITVERAVELPDGNPLRWSLEEFSPFNP